MGIAISPEDEVALKAAIAKKSASLDKYVALYRSQSAVVGESQAMVAMTSAFLIALDPLTAIEYVSVAIKRLADLPEAQPDDELYPGENDDINHGDGDALVEAPVAVAV